MEEQINNLPQAEETAPAPAPEPETSPPAKVEQPLSKAGERLPEGMVDEPPDPSVLQAEVERLREVKRKAEEDASYWRRQKAEARADYFRDRDRGVQVPAPPPEIIPGIAPEPKAADFTDYDDYVKGLTDWRVKQARAQWEMESVRKAQQEAANQRQETLKTKLQEGYQIYPDFEEVAFDRSASHITPMVVDILAECDHPADVAYYLAKNRVEGIAISRMTPLQAARAIARLEDKIVATRSSNPAPQTSNKPTVKAPPPIKPVGSTATVTKDPEKMTQKEYEAWRISQGAKRF
jgi:hypothetical protein